MGEKIYKTMGFVGAWNVAIGITTIVIGLITGIIAIVSGAYLIKKKSDITF